MSKNVSIKEGDRARNFGPTAKIKTELQAGGSCYWVPEDERETGHIFASENREYTPDEINKYGIDSIDVNIIFTGTTIDGDPWSVTIDPDTGLPIIDIDDVEITIDDITGDIDIHIPDKDPDDWPGWDDLDPDLKIDFDDWVNPHDPDDWPGWDDLDPDLKIDFDDWVNDGNDPDDWPGWDDLDPSIKDDFDGFVNPHDPDSWPGWDDLDPSIKDDFDGWINDTDITIDDADLDDFGIDPEADIDISMDDLGNVEISDGDISIDFDPETGEWDTGDCPASIKVMHVPNKTEYTDGEAIDYDGLVMQAYDKDGNPCNMPGYQNGYIPAHELSMPYYADYGSGTDYDLPEYHDTGTAGVSTLYLAGEITEDVTHDIASEAITQAEESYQQGGSKSGYNNSAIHDLMDGNPGNRFSIVTILNPNPWPACTPNSSWFMMNPYMSIFISDGIIGNNVNLGTYYTGTIYYFYAHWNYIDGLVISQLNGGRTTVRAFEGKSGDSVSTIGATQSEMQTQTIGVQWQSPCFGLLKASFDIQVSHKVDHGGSHHSGKF